MYAFGRIARKFTPLSIKNVRVQSRFGEKYHSRANVSFMSSNTTYEAPTEVVEPIHFCSGMTEYERGDSEMTRSTESWLSIMYGKVIHPYDMCAMKVANTTEVIEYEKHIMKDTAAAVKWLDIMVSAARKLTLMHMNKEIVEARVFLGKKKRASVRSESSSRSRSPSEDSRGERKPKGKKTGHPNTRKVTKPGEIRGGESDSDSDSDSDNDRYPTDSDQGESDRYPTDSDQGESSDGEYPEDSDQESSESSDDERRPSNARNTPKRICDTHRKFREQERRGESSRSSSEGRQRDRGEESEDEYDGERSKKSGRTIGEKMSKGVKKLGKFIGCGGKSKRK